MKNLSRLSKSSLIKAGVLTAVTMTSALPMLAQAEGGYVGLQYGNFQSEDADMGNLGITGGYKLGKHTAIEGQYTLSTNEQSLGYGANLGADTLAVYATYKSDGKVYVKGKAGIAKVKYTMDSDWFSASGRETGFSYGVGAGVNLSDRTRIELEYTKLPELERFAGVDMNASGSYTSIGVSFDL